MRKIVVFFLFLAVFSTLSAWDEFNKYSIADELRKPGVKLVAVDFYATWCEPCNAAIPKWKKLQEKYGDKGFELIVVSVQSEGSCSQPPQWNPDKIVCDYDGDIADAWHANNLPQAFLWSWQGNLLVAHGGVDNVAAAIEKYFKNIPRVYVEEGNDKNLYNMVRSELAKKSKIEIVASDKERAKLAELRKKSSGLNYDQKLQCKLGEEVSANSRLVISKQKRGKKNALVLELFSVEKGCLTASGTATIRGNPEQEVAEAVYTLLKNLLGDVKMPSEDGRKAKQPKPAFQTGRFSEESDDWEIGGGEETIVKFESNPAGAAVSIDGKVRCQMTPCSKSVTEGTHKIEIIKDDGCYKEWEETITIGNNKKSVYAEMKPRESAIKVYAQDEKGNDIDADVYVDNKKVGRAPGTFKVPLCSKKLLIKNGDFEYSEEISLKEKQVKTLQAKLKRKGLQWSNKAPNIMNWNDAKQYCANLNEGGHSDWRLPNIDELKTLIGNEQSKLGDTRSFWSSSTQSDNTDGAWGVLFGNGHVGNYGKSSRHDVRCVR